MVLNRIRVIFFVCALFASLLCNAADTKRTDASLTNPNDTVLVELGDARITQADFDAMLQKLPDTDRAEFRRQIRRITNALEQMLLTRVLANEAVAMEIDRDPQVQTRLLQAREGVLSDVRIEAFRKTVKIPDLEAAAKEDYKINLEKFRIPARVHASHILVDNKKRSLEEALERAKEIREKLASGADFGSLALEYSDDPGVQRNKGDLGFFGKGRMVKEFEQAAFGMEVGEISDPVKSQFGYHLIKLVARQEEKDRPYEVVRESIIKRLQNEYLDRATTEYLDSIRKDKGIRLNTRAIDALQTFLPNAKH